MDDQPVPPVTAAGDRSVASSAISGTVASGDHATIDQREIHLPPGSITDPAQTTLTAPAAYLPRPPARVFTGRDDALATLSGTLDDGTAAVVTQAIYGLGGIGKSELALHHAHIHATRYQLRWWITATSAQQIQDGLAALAARLCPPIALAGATAEAAAWALSWLQTHDRWLLILDNLENPNHALPLLGQLTTGHIIITTRRDTNWQQLAQPIPLDTLPPDAAAKIITTRTGHTAPEDHAAARAIAAELGHLPLAQAAGYITATRTTPANYLARLREHPARMYAATGGDGSQRTIARLWDITLAAVTTRNPDAVRLLHVLACYAPDNIPRALASGPDGDEETDEALGLLASYTMITLTQHTISIHRLLQAVLLNQHPPGEQHAEGSPNPRDTALEWLGKVIPSQPGTNVSAWPLLRDLVPHAEALTCHYPRDSQPVDLALVHNEIASFHQSQGDYQRALALRHSVLRTYLTALGPNDRRTASAMGNLALTYRALGQFAIALPLAQRALAITEAALGPEHPNTATDLGNLAVIYHDLGQFAIALPLRQRALAIMETSLGPNHPLTASAMGNLAATYWALDRHADALPLEQRALAISEAVQGPDHPDTALRLNNLAAAYHDLAQYAAALPLAQRALAITEAALGPDHPDIAARLNNLAGIYRGLGQYAAALPLAQRTLAIAETSLGPGHPNTATALRNLALTYRGLGRPADALLLEQRAAQINKPV